MGQGQDAARAEWLGVWIGQVPAKQSKHAAEATERRDRKERPQQKQSSQSEGSPVTAFAIAPSLPRHPAHPLGFVEERKCKNECATPPPIRPILWLWPPSSASTGQSPDSAHQDRAVKRANQEAGRDPTEEGPPGKRPFVLCQWGLPTAVDGTVAPRRSKAPRSRHREAANDPLGPIAK